MWAHGPRPLGPMGPIFNTFGPGAGAGTPWARGLGAPGPRLQDTHGECNYLLSGRLPTVRQAKTVRHAPNRSIDLHPTTAYMHPKVSIYMHPTTAYLHPTAP